MFPDKHQEGSARDEGRRSAVTVTTLGFNIRHIAEIIGTVISKTGVKGNEQELRRWRRLLVCGLNLRNVMSWWLLVKCIVQSIGDANC